LTPWPVAILPYIEQSALSQLWNSKAPVVDPSNATVRQTQIPTYICPSDMIKGGMLVTEAYCGGYNNVKYAPSSYVGVEGATPPGQTAHWDWAASSPGSTTDEWSSLLAGGYRGWRGVLHAFSFTNSLWPESAADIKDGLSNTTMISERHLSIDGNMWPVVAWTGPSAGCVAGDVMSNPWILQANHYNQCDAAFPSYNCDRGFGAYHPGGFNWALCDGSVRFISITVDMNVLMAAATIAGNETMQLP
jgi:prepilin-type processing-associated H-X9-DG protein